MYSHVFELWDLNLLAEHLLCPMTISILALRIFSIGCWECEANVCCLGVWCASQPLGSEGAEYRMWQYRCDHFLSIYYKMVRQDKSIIGI